MGKCTVTRLAVIFKLHLVFLKIMGAIHSTKIQTGPTGKRGPPQKVDPFFRNFSSWTEPIHWVLDRNFRKVWLNGSRPMWPFGLDGVVLNSLAPAALMLWLKDKRQRQRPSSTINQGALRQRGGFFFSRLHRSCLWPLKRSSLSYEKPLVPRV